MFPEPSAGVVPVAHGEPGGVRHRGDARSGIIGVSRRVRSAAVGDYRLPREPLASVVGVGDSPAGMGHRSQRPPVGCRVAVSPNRGLRHCARIPHGTGCHPPEPVAGELRLRASRSDAKHLLAISVVLADETVRGAALVGIVDQRGVARMVIPHADASVLVSVHDGPGEAPVGTVSIADPHGVLRPRLDKIDIEEAVVSIDAMGTQVEVARKILDKKAHYFLAVKDNQKGLNEAVSEAFRLNAPTDAAIEMGGDHGRVETRTCRILPAEAIAEADVANRWPGLKTIAEVETEVFFKKTGESVRTLRHYISDESFPKAAYYNMLARGHWSIENLLHWHLDVTFLEDCSRARKGNAAQNLSLIRKLALQIVKAYNDKRSLRKRLFKASLDPNYLLELLLSYQI